MQFTFGVDANGFFIEPVSAGTPFLTINNFQVSGGVTGEGQVGAAQVTLTAGTVNIDPTVGFTVNLTDPTTDPNNSTSDGRIRLSQFNSSIITDQFQSGTSGQAVVFNATLAADDLTTGTALPADLQNDAPGQITITWANAANATNATVTGDNAAGQTLDGFLSETNSSLASTQLKAIISGLQQVATWAQSLSSFQQLAQPLPLVDKSIGAVVNIGNDLQNDVVNPLNALTFNTTDDFVAGLKALTASSNGINVSNVTGGVQGNDLQFGMTLSVTGTTSVPVDLGTGASSFGLGLDASAQLSLNTSLSFSFTFGIDLTPGLSLGDSFFVNIGTLTAGVSLAANNLNLGLHAGFIDAEVVNGNVNLNASLGLQFNNPNGGGPGGNITLNGLQGTNLAGLISIVPPTASLTATLPVTTNLFPIAGSPAITLSDTDLFSGAPLNVSVNSDFTNLLGSFSNLSASDFIAMFTKLGSSLQNIASSFNPGSIPLVGKQVSDIINFTETTAKLANQSSGRSWSAAAAPRPPAGSSQVLPTCLSP